MWNRFATTEYGFQSRNESAEVGLRNSRQSRNDISYTDFSGLEHSAQEREAMEAWAGRRLHPLENIDPPQDEGSLAALAVVVLVACIGVVAGIFYAVRWALS